MKRFVTVFLALSLLIGSAAPAFAFPDRPPKAYDEVYKYYEEYDGTWKWLAYLYHPELPEPTGPAAQSIYIAVYQGLYYKPDFDKETGTVGPKFKPWNAPMTRNDFVETLYYVLYYGLSDGVSRAYEVQSYLSSWREINPQLTDTYDKIMYEYHDYYNGNYQGNDFMFSAVYGPYYMAGGPLDATNFAEFILPYMDTLPDYQRLYQFIDCDNIWAEKLAGLGIVEGDAEGNLHPDELITRQEAAALMARTLQTIGIPAVPKGREYADDADIAEWAKDGIYQLSALQEFGEPILQSVGDNRFDPQGQLTNEEAMVWAVRLKYFISHYIMVHAK